MTAAFEALSITKTFRPWFSTKAVRALDDLTLSVERGSIFGLLGPNGAGKTTLVKIALTIARPDSGHVRILGEPVRDRSILGRVGYLPENPRFPSHLTARQVLRLYGSLSGADEAALKRNSEIWLERVGLQQWADSRVVKFSKGMNERLALAQALVHDPDFVFLDEPTDGLDPMGRMEVRALCKELASTGKTIFINSHILAEIELICDRVALMKEGRIIECGSVGEVTKSAGGYEVMVPCAEGFPAWLQERRLPFTTVNGHFHIQVPDRNAANALIDALRQKNIEIEGLAVKRRTLESVFIERVRDL